MITLEYTLWKLSPFEVWSSLHGLLHALLWGSYSGKYEVHQWYYTHYHLTWQDPLYRDPL